MKKEFDDQTILKHKIISEYRENKNPIKVEYYDGDVDNEEEFFEIEMQVTREIKRLKNRKQDILKYLEGVPYDDSVWERIRLFL